MAPASMPTERCSKAPPPADCPTTTNSGRLDHGPSLPFPSSLLEARAFRRTKRIRTSPGHDRPDGLAFALRTAIGFGVVEMLCLVGVLSTVRVNVLGERHQVAGSGCSMESDMPWLYTPEARERTLLAVHAGMFSSQRPGHFGRTSTSVVPTNWSGTNARVVRNERRVEPASRPFHR